MQKPFVRINLFKNDISILQIGGTEPFYDKELLLDLFGYSNGECNIKSIEEAWKSFVEGEESKECENHANMLSKDMGEFELELEKTYLDQETEDIDMAKFNEDLNNFIKNLDQDTKDKILADDEMQDRLLEALHALYPINRCAIALDPTINTIRSIIGEENTIRLIHLQFCHNTFNGSENVKTEFIKSHQEEAKVIGDRIADIFKEAFKQFEKDHNITLDEDTKKFMFDIIRELATGKNAQCLMLDNPEMILKIATLPYCGELIPFLMKIVDDNLKKSDDE